MADRPRIEDLIVADEDDRDPADYGSKVAALPRTQAEWIMDAVDTFGAGRVSWTGPLAADGAIVLERPTGKMHATLRLTRVGVDGEPIGSDDIVPDTKPQSV